MNVYNRCQRHPQLILVKEFQWSLVLLTPQINIHSQISSRIFTKNSKQSLWDTQETGDIDSWKICEAEKNPVSDSLQWLKHRCLQKSKLFLPSFPDDRQCAPRTGPYIPQPILPFTQGCPWCLVFTGWTMLSVVREGSITPRDGPPLPSSTSREGADMTAAGGRPSSRTTSAPTSPLKEKPRSSFLGKVTSLSQVRITV